jgi:C4-dicarboxylate-binding protein DctP
MLTRILLILILPLSFSTPSLAEQSPLVIRLSTQASKDADYFQSMLHFKERVEESSHGAIRVDIYDSGKLYESDKVAAAVSAGEVEMAMVNLPRFAGAIPIADAYSLPFLFSNETLERASRKPASGIRVLIDDAILKQSGARVLWWIPEGSFVLLSKNAPISTPDDLSGKSVRSSGPTSAATLAACGGKPIEIPATQQPEAYASGRVEVGMTSIAAVIARKLFIPMKIISRNNQAHLNDVVVINEGYWRSLSDDYRRMLVEAAAAADQEAADRAVRFEEKAYDRLIGQEGATVMTLATHELMAWRMCSSDILSDFMAKAGASGQKLMAAYAKLLQDPCCDQPRGQNNTAH